MNEYAAISEAMAETNSSLILRFRITLPGTEDCLTLDTCEVWCHAIFPIDHLWTGLTYISDSHVAKIDSRSTLHSCRKRYQNRFAYFRVVSKLEVFARVVVYATRLLMACRQTVHIGGCPRKPHHCLKTFGCI